MMRAARDDTSPRERQTALDDVVEHQVVLPLRHAGRRYWVLLLLPLALGLALRVGLAATDRVITNDATAYLESGRNLLEGRGFSRDGGTAELHFPPVAPVVIGGLWKVSGSPVFALAFTTLAAGFAALFPMIALGRRLGGDRGGVATAWVAALAGGVSVIPATAGGGSESIYLLLLLTATWLVVSLPDRVGRARVVAAAWAGLASGLLYLTRPEGFFLCLLLLVVVAIGDGVVPAAWARDPAEVRARLQANLRPTAAFAAVLALCVAPYVTYLHSHTGSWELSAKSQDVSIEAWRAVAEGDRRARDAELYKLDETGLALVDRGASLPALAKDDPAGYAGIVRANVLELRDQYVGFNRVFHRPLPVWPHLPLPLVGLALWAGWRLRRNPAAVTLAAIGGLALATSIGFFVQPRYLIPVTAVLVILAGAGIGLLLPRRQAWAFGLAVVLLAYPPLQDLERFGGMWETREPVEHMLAGEWVAENSPGSSRIMSRSLVTEYYSEREAVALPYGSINQTVRFAYHHGADYLVVDEFLLNRFRPQYAPLFGDGPWPGLRLEHEIRYKGRLTRIFALDPPPPVDSADPPGLGFVGDG